MRGKIPSRGLGDTIAKFTSWLGIAPCGGCERRRQLLNEWMPYRPSRPAIAFAPSPAPARVSMAPRQFESLARSSINAPPLELVRVHSLETIRASGGGWRAPDRRSGPLDWEGDRRERRATGSNPGTSPGGSGTPASFACGIDVTDAMKAAMTSTRGEFLKLTPEKKHEACSALHSLRTGAYAWDIIDLHRQVTNDALNKPYRPICATSGATPACGSSVTVDGSCHFAGSANYVIFGLMCKLCSTHYHDLLANASWYEIIDKDAYRRGIVQFSKAGMLGLIDLYKKYVPMLQLDAPAGNIDTAKRWSIAGYDGWPTGGGTPAPDRGNCTLTCPHRAPATFQISWYPFLNPYSR